MWDLPISDSVGRLCGVGHGDSLVKFLEQDVGCLSVWKEGKAGCMDYIFAL